MLFVRKMCKMIIVTNVKRAIKIIIKIIQGHLCWDQRKANEGQ